MSPRPRRAPVAATFLAALLAPHRAAAAPAEPPPSSRSAEAPAAPTEPERGFRFAPASRADLARAYLRFEAALGEHPERTDDDLRRWGIAFDRATRQFFRGDRAAGIRMLAAIERDASDRPWPAQARLAAALTARPDPSRLAAGSTDPLRVRVRSVYPADLPQAPAPDAIALRLRPAGTDRPVARTEFPVRMTADGPAADDDATLEPPPTGWPAGTLLLEAGGPGRWITLAQLPSLDPPLPELVASLRARLDAAEAARDIPPIDLHTARVRLKMLAGEPTGHISATLLDDPTRLARDTARAVDRIERGEPAYLTRSGEHWVLAGPDRTPVAVRVPDRPRPDAPDRPRDLLVTLHGAGADERIWLDGYGSGAVGRAAEQHGLTLLAPRSYGFVLTPARLAPVVDAVHERLVETGLAPADPGADPGPPRLLLLGHSMGGIAAAGAAGALPDRVRAAVCVAGFAQIQPPPGREPASLPPVRLYSAGLDPIVPAASIERLARASQRAGAPVEIHPEPAHTHTLILPAVIPEAVDWLASLTR